MVTNNTDQGRGTPPVFIRVEACPTTLRTEFSTQSVNYVLQQKNQWLQLGHRRTENWRAVAHIPKER